MSRDYVLDIMRADKSGVAAWIKAEYLDKGKMGTANGKGVYTYPNPAYQDPDFLK